MSAITLNQRGTVWRFLGQDGLGGTNFAAPELVNCKTKFENRITYTQNGREEIDDFIFYTDVDLKKRDFVVLGESAELNPVDAGAQEVRTVIKGNPLHPTLVKAIA